MPIPHPILSKVGNRGLANDKPQLISKTLVYMNSIFYLVDHFWWTADEDGLLRNVVDVGLLETLNRVAFPDIEESLGNMED